MIRAVVFDCFGVLATDGWLPFKYEQFSHNQELFDQASELNRQAAAGLITYDDFVQGIADMANMPSLQVLQALEGNQANRPLFAVIESLKPDYKIGLLSNTASNRLKELFTSEQLAVFDSITLSYEDGFVKPDPRAYQIGAQQLGVEIEACVMVDDQERNCQAARDVGMQAILYQDFEDFKKELSAVLVKR